MLRPSNSTYPAKRLHQKTPDQNRLGLRSVLSGCTRISLSTKPPPLHVKTPGRPHTRCCLVTIAAVVLGIAFFTRGSVVAQSTFTNPTAISIPDYPNLATPLPIEHHGFRTLWGGEQADGYTLWSDLHRRRERPRRHRHLTSRAKRPKHYPHVRLLPCC